MAGAALYVGVQKVIMFSRKPPKDAETDPSIATEIVWKCIGGALSAAQLHVGDELNLYNVLRECCYDSKDASVTAITLASRTGFHQRWLREWLAHQAALGILQLLPGTKDDDSALHYRLPRATSDVLANPSSPHYNIAMVSLVPSLVQRAHTMLPSAFRTGLGRPYDEPSVTAAIDRQHAVHIRDVFLPRVVQTVLDGRVHRLLTSGCQVADLGCGAGNLVRALAVAYPQSTFHGFEVSAPALEQATEHTMDLPNVIIHDANQDPLGDHSFDIVTTLDVLHDAPNPAVLIHEVRRALGKGGVWLLADIPSRSTLRESITDSPMASTYLAFSTCLCLSCSLSTSDGAGLGTLGFTVPVARRMLIEEGGFATVNVILEDASTRWFLVQ